MKNEIYDNDDNDGTSLVSNTKCMKTLNSSIIDEDVKKLLYLFIKENTFHYVLYGGENTDKTDVIKMYLREYYELKYNDSIHNCEYIYIYNGLHDTCVQQFKQDIFHFCKLTNPNKKQKRTIFIYDLDNINDSFQNVIKDVIDAYKDKINIIITCSHIERIKELLKSRLYIIKMKGYTNENLMKVLNDICMEKNIKFEEDHEIDCKSYIIDKCEHSLKRLISLMEKIRLSSPKLNLEQIKHICCFIDETYFIEFSKQWCIEQSLSKAILTLKDIMSKGYSIIDIFEMYCDFIKTTKEEFLSESLKHSIVIIISKYIVNFYCLHENEIELYLFPFELIQLVK